MTKTFELKESPIFDDEELYTSFTEWHQRVAEERMVLNEILGGFGKRLLINMTERTYTLGDVENVDGGDKLFLSDGGVAYYDNTAHTGFFGINQSAPTVALDVNGSLNVTGGVMFSV